MQLEFDPNNEVILKCLKAQKLFEDGKDDEANIVFIKAQEKVSNKFEEFIFLYYQSRVLIDEKEKLSILKKAISIAKNLNNDIARSALTSLANQVADIYQKQGKIQKYSEYNNLAQSYIFKISDIGPFYHGTNVKLNVGDLLKPGFKSNYNSDVIMNHIYFTASKRGAAFAAELVAVENKPYVYLVEPLGNYENDPNVTNQRFIGNPTRSYRSDKPLRILEIITKWEQHSPDQIKAWREKVKNNKGKIIN